MKIHKSLRNDNALSGQSQLIGLLNNELPLIKKMEQLRDSLSFVKLIPNGENILIRLLIEGLGLKIYFPRTGDNSERFDATIDFIKYKAVAEIEIPSNEILDAPRNLLDDYVVLKCRKKSNDTEIVPLVICWDLPNKRTDYWNVITDIHNVLDIKIKTISILALALHYWLNESLSLENDDYFLDYTNSSMKHAINLLKKADLSESNFPGYFTPFK